MWQNGYSFTPYQRGAIDRTGSLLGRLVGAFMPFLPYLFVALLTHTPGKTDTRNSTWNALAVLLLAALVFLAELGLTRVIQRLASRNLSAAAGFWLFSIIILVLHIWSVQAGTAYLLRRWSEGHTLSLLATALFLPVALSRWIRTNFRPRGSSQVN